MPSPPPLAPAAAAAAAAAPAQGGGRSLLLYSPADHEHLSPLVCLMRSQLELFSATPADVAERAAIGGISKQITPGRVGIRCVHCKSGPAGSGGGQPQPPQPPQAKGSTSYPKSLRVLHQVSKETRRAKILFRPCAVGLPFPSPLPVLCLSLQSFVAGGMSNPYSLLLLSPCNINSVDPMHVNRLCETGRVSSCDASVVQFCVSTLYVATRSYMYM
jgi:hypothetical protein